MRIAGLLVCIAAGCAGPPLRGGQNDLATDEKPDLQPPADLAPCPADALCKLCTQDADCSGNTPRCDVGSGRCLACLPAMDNCPNGAFCQLVNNHYTCVMGCKNDADCQAPPSDGGPPAKMMCCMNSCVDVANDGAHCGLCGNACKNGTTCCGAACADLSSDLANCGGCGIACAGQHASWSCWKGACAVAMCQNAFADCNMNPSDGCEANLAADPMNCTTCGKSCFVANGAGACMNGCVLQSCNMGFANCDGNAANGCESLLAFDLNNCGMCGKKCPGVPNGFPACANSMCTLGGCIQGFDDCDMQVPNGCEAKLDSDSANCGGCGISCVAAPHAQGSCVAAKCAFNCDAGFGNCDGSSINGCEAPLDADRNNCGMCGKVCAVANGTPACSNGACAVAACNAGFGDCNGNPADGCEANLTNDKNNCGQCGNACQSCVNSMCSVCNTAVLILGENQPADTALVNALNGNGMVATLVAGGSNTYAGNPPASNYGAVIILTGTTYTGDMPLGGQNAVLAASNLQTGVITTEWAAYQITTGHYQTLASLILLARTSGATAQLTFNLESMGHPIWNGLPVSFTTVASMGANSGNTIQNGGMRIAGCTQCGAGAGVVVRDNGKGRVVQIAHAASYNAINWVNDANLSRMMVNAAKWAARCQ